jgi:energy-converting hydrogenase B subunit D
MTVVQVVTLTVVLLLGVTVVLTYDVIRQTFVNAIFGMSLVLLFTVLQAPDVALSALVVGTVAVPLVLLTAIRRTSDRSRDEAGEQ